MNLSLVLRTALGALLIGLHSAAPARAQQSPPSAPPAGERSLRGQVLKGGEGVPGVPVTLHRVLRQESGPLGTVVTDAAGRFRFPLPPADTGGTAVLFATAEYHSVRYFGRAVHPGASVDDYAVEVFDTASSLPLPIRLSRRDMVFLPREGGGWEVDEIVRINNPNLLTLAPAGGLPGWQLQIPEGVEAFEVGESEVPANAVQRMGDRVLLTIPLTPGQREMYLRYLIPASRAEAVLDFDSPADTFNLFVRQPSPRLEITGLTSTDMIEVAGDQFLRYAGTDLAEGSTVRIEWESVAPPVDPVVAAVVATLLLLAVGAVAAARGTRGGSAPARETPSASRELAAGRAE